jgi:peptidoglycan/LPS O-acetylase OafA/YrhL
MINEERKHLPELDSIRAIASILVIFTHWQLPKFELQVGWIGVNLFFVLSGYLITNILISDKHKSIGSFLKYFYLKRVLRIFPLYFGYIFLCILVTTGLYFTVMFHKTAVSEINNAFPNLTMLGTFTYNYYYFAKEVFHLGVNPSSAFIQHLWSISLEEQFYLIFPFIVWFLNARYLKIVVIAIIIGCPLARLCYGLYVNGTANMDSFMAGEMMYKSLFFQADALAVGALLALVKIDNRKCVIAMFIASIVVLVAFSLTNLYYLRLGNPRFPGKSFGLNYPAYWIMDHSGLKILDLRYAYFYTLINFASACLILCGINGISFKILDNRFLRFIGKISFGTYVYQGVLNFFFMGVFYKMLLSKGFLGNIWQELIYFIIYFITLIGVSFVSFEFFEKRILALKHKLH